ncbi:SapC family protein [Ferrigenium kumadai]|uniref:SapC family protein n=1 Tax=Ferrigenium kumadai TaxID=1682490 RepID=A0AAN1W0R0_9PROT|nr:SapC family protein [Ferrigenium kumadai]BBI99572.1 SapC family protein [Ferrigenium kumadai]
MSNFAFYRKVVALNSDVHRNLKFASNEVTFTFARDTNAVLMAGVEFAEAAREYPIVFIRGEDQKMRPVALLGVRNGENLFVDEEGKWDARYIPAFVRRYPFVMAEGGAQGQLIVCIDENCPALNTEHGELLIDKEGRLQPRMNEMMQFLQNFQQEFTRTELLMGQLDELGLFVQQGARFDTPAGGTFQLNDFFLIDEAKFGQIADDKLPLLFRSGALGMIYLHLASLGNMRKLLDRLSARSAITPGQNAAIH